MHCPLCNSKNNINFQKSTKGLIFVKNKFHKFKTTKTICKNCHHIFNSKKLPKNLMAKNYVTLPFLPIFMSQKASFSTK